MRGGRVFLRALRPRFSGKSAGSMRQLCDRAAAASSVPVPPLGNSAQRTYIPDRLRDFTRAVFPSARLLRRTRRYVRLCLTRTHVVSRMRQRRRRVFIDTHKGCVSAGFTVAAEADAADVSMRLRERGWIAYRLRLEAEQHAWVATVIDWARRAA